jgi:hypothetical protein
MSPVQHHINEFLGYFMRAEHAMSKQKTVQSNSRQDAIATPDFTAPRVDHSVAATSRAENFDVESLADRLAPSAVRHALVGLHQSGRAHIHGITFDLSPNELLGQGWQSRAHVGLDMGGRNGPLLRFPWRDPTLEEFLDEKWTAVQAGDHIFVHKIESKSCGDMFDHPDDQVIRLVTLAIRRGEETIIIEDPVEYMRAGSFSSHLGVNYASAIHRVNDILGDNPDSADALSEADDTYYQIPERQQNNCADEERVYADRARQSSFSSGAILIDLRLQTLLAELDVPESIARALREDVHEQIKGVADAATAVGYWLAKAEFAPHIDDTRVGKKRRETSRKTGMKRGAVLAKAADETWRNAGLELARQLRGRNPKMGQGPLAGKIIDALKLRKCSPPGYDTVVEQIKRWQNDGVLSRSASYHNPAAARGVNKIGTPRQLSKQRL